MLVLKHYEQAAVHKRARFENGQNSIQVFCWLFTWAFWTDIAPSAMFSPVFLFVLKRKKSFKCNWIRQMAVQHLTAYFWCGPLKEKKINMQVFTVQINFLEPLCCSIPDYLLQETYWITKQNPKISAILFHIIALVSSDLLRILLL